ncbi:SDR family oxidoreductase [Paenibacillus sp. SI8]|uniref:SDR family oxidoreductase n=1 Tax=unclassified Paenibacillus TaxID=185978 RepID=UPI003467C285
MKLSGHCVLITGGSAGIGLSLATRLSKLGNKVIIASSSQEKLNQAVQSCPTLIPYACNLDNLEALPAFAEKLIAEHPDLNLLINNAGIQFRYNWLTEPDIPVKINREIRVNLISAMQMCSAFLPHLAKKPEAAIVNVSSGLGLVPKKEAPVYCATKAAIHIFTKSLRYQLADTTVKVFEIIPPLVDTELTQGRGKGKISPDQLTDEFINAFERNRYEIRIGKVKLLNLINRLAPAVADRIMRDR